MTNRIDTTIVDELELKEVNNYELDFETIRLMRYIQPKETSYIYKYLRRFMHEPTKAELYLNGQ